MRPVTPSARADTPRNSYGTVATYECDPGYEFDDNTTVKSFTCGSNGWIPPPQSCNGNPCIFCEWLPMTVRLSLDTCHFRFCDTSDDVHIF